MPRELKDPEIIIRKGQRVLELCGRGGLVKSFAIVLGPAPNGNKQVEGDGKTPEGEFYVFAKNSQSKFHLSLGLGYPSKEDAKRGFAAGLINEADHHQIVTAIENGKMPLQKTVLGGEIYIHGGGTDRDWTEGCVAMLNEDIEELFNAIPLGTKVTILA